VPSLILARGFQNSNGTRHIFVAAASETRTLWAALPWPSGFAA
jgi:hypothetical protein